MHLKVTTYVSVRTNFRLSATFGNKYAFVTVKFTAVTLKFQVAANRAYVVTRDGRIPNE